MHHNVLSGSLLLVIHVALVAYPTPMFWHAKYCAPPVHILYGQRLHHDSAPCHIAITVNTFWLKNHSCGSSTLYLPDLSLCNFFLFLKIKNHLKGKHFGTLENIQKAVTYQLKAIPVCDFQQYYEEWEQRLQSYVASQGSNFEGDNVELDFFFFF